MSTPSILSVAIGGAPDAIASSMRCQTDGASENESMTFGTDPPSVRKELRLSIAPALPGCLRIAPCSTQSLGRASCRRGPRRPRQRGESRPRGSRLARDLGMLRSMIEPPIPADKNQRLALLKACNIIYTPVWSMGTVLYQLVTGADPFGGEGDMQIFANVMTKSPTPVADHAKVPPDAKAILMRCLSRPREDRFESMTTLASALRSSRNRATRPSPARSCACRLSSPA